jgi:hypothetical protein
MVPVVLILFFIPLLQSGVVLVGMTEWGQLEALAEEVVLLLVVVLELLGRVLLVVLPMLLLQVVAVVVRVPLGE